jgi:phenylacetate-coenzyme A ligase PaaK-like adenylate-forming protein
MMIVKGVNVFPLGIQATLMTLAPRITGEFQVTLDRPPPIDYPVPITVEVARDVPAARHAELAREVAEALKKEQNFAAAVTLVPAGSLGSDGKVRRLVRAYRAAAP